LCPINDYKYIADKLYEIIINKSLRITMGNASLRIIEENFRPETAFAPYLSLIGYNSE